MSDPLTVCILTSSASGAIVAAGVAWAFAKRYQPPRA